MAGMAEVLASSIRQVAAYTGRTGISVVERQVYVLRIHSAEVEQSHS